MLKKQKNKTKQNCIKKKIPKISLGRSQIGLWALVVMFGFYAVSAISSEHTSELRVILMALNYIRSIQLAIFNILIYVNLKSVLYALENWDCKLRRWI